MQHFNIPLINTGQIHELSIDYIIGNPKIRDLYDFEPSLNGIKAAIDARKNFPVNRAILTMALRNQYQKLNSAFFENPDNDKVKKNIELLSSNNAFTITTGHQLNIFTGPLYFIYKIISAIKYAEDLKEAFSEYDFVPVYWMASEDHDFEEINHFHLWGAEINWDTEAAGAVGRLNPQSLDKCIKALEKLLEREKNGVPLIELFQKAYGEHNTLADATRYLVNSLFASEGLIIIDGDDADLKKELIPVLEDDIFGDKIYNSVQKTISAIGNNYKLPVSPREINVFYLKDHSRKRIIKSDGNFKEWEGAKSWTADQLKEEIHTHPENFSPNVILRGMYQERILPNLTYIGGNNEIAYWLELKEAFKVENVFFPQLLVRDSALFVGKKAAKDIQLLNLQIEDFFLSLEDLKFKFYKVNMLDHIAEKDAAGILDKYEILKKDIQGLPADLVAGIVKSLNLHTKELRKWKNDIHNIQMQLQEKNIQKLDKIYKSFYPGEEFQERHENFIPYYLRYGMEWFGMLKSNCNPLAAACHIFVED
jgi:bacillithiol synthase